MSQKELEKLNLPIEKMSNILRNNGGELREMVLKYTLILSGKHDCSQLYSEVIINDILGVAEKFNSDIGQLALDTIINVTAAEKGCEVFTESQIYLLLNFAFGRDSILADHACKILANISRHEEKASIVSHELLEHHGLGELMTALCDKSYNEKGFRLEYLAQVVGNLTQCEEFRSCLLDPMSGQFQRLMPILVNGTTILERRGIASVLYNCLLDSENHLILLNPPYELLPVLLYPLAGPEEFEESEYEQLPLDLQYLPEDKNRESDPQIRHLLLKCILLLCKTKLPRCFVRDHGTYLILREYHKWEKDSRLTLAIENVVDLLIRTEEEIGIDDLGTVEIPPHMEEQFNKWDNDFITS